MLANSSEQKKLKANYGIKHMGEKFNAETELMIQTENWTKRKWNKKTEGKN